MSVTQRHQGIGAWTLTLDPNAPKHIRDEIAEWGHIVITVAHIDPNVGDTALLAASRYTGIVRTISDGGRSLAGPGLAAYLGDEDGKGTVVEESESVTAASFSSAVDTLVTPAPSTDPIINGTLTNISGSSITASYAFVTRRFVLDDLCDLAGGEWRINPDATLDVGLDSDLFTTTPTVVVTTKGGGRDVAVVGLDITDANLAKDWEDYTTRVVLLAEGAYVDVVGVGTADVSPATTYKDLQGNALQMVRLIDAPSTSDGNADGLADAHLGDFNEARTAVTLSTLTHDIGGDVEVGDTIAVYDPDLGLVDTANQVTYRGETIFPIHLRVLGYTWPIQGGSGVYYRDSAGSYTDLTDWVSWESGPTALEIGAKPRSAVSGSSSGGPIGRLSGNGPQGVLGHAETSTAQTGIGSTQTPLNDLSVTVTVGTGRRIKVSWSVDIQQLTNTSTPVGWVQEDGTDKALWCRDTMAASDRRLKAGSSSIFTPTSGSHTYRLTLHTGSGTVETEVAQTNSITVEDIGEA